MPQMGLEKEPRNAADTVTEGLEALQSNPPNPDRARRAAAFALMSALALGVVGGKAEAGEVKSGGVPVASGEASSGVEALGGKLKGKLKVVRQLPNPLDSIQIDMSTFDPNDPSHRLVLEELNRLKAKFGK